MRNRDLKHIFDTLERTFRNSGIDSYLIGALARQVWYEKSAIEFRTTKDVDYAVLIGSHKEYEMIKQHLKEKENFSEYSGNAFVMIAPDGTQIDILPFGEIESNGGVEVTGIGMTSIKVDGMKEVYLSGTKEVVLETGNTFKVATLPAIVLLKFIAYDDRPEQRQKDALDIANILEHFFDLNSDLVYDNHNDLFGDEYTLESIAAIAMGREMRKIASNNETLVNRLLYILNNHIELYEKSSFIKLMVQSRNSNVEEITEYLKNIRDGFSQISK